MKITIGHGSFNEKIQEIKANSVDINLDQTINGTKTFATTPKVNNKNILVAGDVFKNIEIASSTNISDYSAPINVSAVQKSAGEAFPINITTTIPHLYKVGDTVLIDGLKTSSCNSSALNGTFTIAEIVSDTQFRYYIAGNNTTALANIYCGAVPTARILTPNANIANVNNNLYFRSSPSFISDKINITNNKTIATSTTIGRKGDICYDSNYIYICVDTNTWKRSGLSSW